MATMSYLGLTGREYFIDFSRRLWGYDIKDAISQWNSEPRELREAAEAANRDGELLASRQLIRQANKVERKQSATANRLIASVTE